MIWRYSPRNGDGSHSCVHFARRLIIIWRYSPRNGDGSDIDVHAERLLDRKFGDIVPGMGTEASIISQSVTRLNVDNLEI